MLSLPLLIQTLTFCRRSERKSECREARTADSSIPPPPDRRDASQYQQHQPAAMQFVPRVPSDVSSHRASRSIPLRHRSPPPHLLPPRRTAMESGEAAEKEALAGAAVLRRPSGIPARWHGQGREPV